MFSGKHFSIFFIALLLILGSCAKKGRPSGGPKDEDPPLLVTANPPYETTNFDSKEIKIEFNEFITLKELTKQLVVSPPLKNNPIITPQGTPAKYIKIELLDTLLENTTYIFDFGKSVQDNNEGNQLEKFKYVFSTGDYIDSLTIKGSVADAFDSKTNKNIKLLLFRADSTYNDSLIYKQKPNYVSSTLDTTLFEFSNLAPGRFHLFALDDKNSDYFFDPKQDKIGYYNRIITLPGDSIIQEQIKLFREILPYRFVRAKEDKKGKIIIGFEGDGRNIEVRSLSETTDKFKSNYKFEPGRDTVNYWYHNYEKDSIILLIKNNNFLDTAVVKLRKKKRDSLSFDRVSKGYLEFNDTLLFSSNTPILSIDTSKVEILDKDTLQVKFKSFISKNQNKFGFLFDKKLNQKYEVKLLPNAVKNIYGDINDTLVVPARMRKLEDYGDFTLDIQNPENKHLIVQLITERNVLISQKKYNASGKLLFDFLRPQKLKVRILHDANKNGIWDTGNFLEKVQPESILYYPSIFEIRPNWSLNETITINKDF